MCYASVIIDQTWFLFQGRVFAEEKTVCVRAVTSYCVLRQDEKAQQIGTKLAECKRDGARLLRLIKLEEIHTGAIH